MRNISVDRYDTRGGCFKISSDHVNHSNQIVQLFIYHIFNFSVMYLIMIFVNKVLKQNYYMKVVLYVKVALV
jgi:hypothetical protein